MGVLLFDRLSLSSQRSPPSSCSSFSRSTSHSSSSEEKPSVFTPYTSATHVPADSDLLVVSSSSSFASSSSSSSSFTPSPDFDSEEDILPASSTSPSSQKKSLYLTSSATSLEGKYVGLFFGAAWCPYCKTFMTSLLNFYNLLHPTNMFEVVYVPLDRNMREYKSFVNIMPWYALPLRNYGDLLRKYKVKSLPSLVLITPDDAVLIDDAAEYVREKNSGEKFKQIFQRYSGPATIGNRFQSLFY